MKTYLKALCLLMVGIALIFGSCSKKKTTEPTPTTDTQKPTVSITAPTYEAVYVTNQETVNLSGNASDNIGVTSVTWANVSKATSGSCIGTTNWSVSGITLQGEDNLIVVTAYDAANNAGKDSITVTYNQYLSFTTDPTADPSGVIVGQSTDIIIRVGIAPNPNLLEDSVRLLKVNSQGQVIDSLNSLYDDGNLSHGDDIAGDGVFSTKQNFYESSEGTTRLRIMAMTQETQGNIVAYTSVFTLPVISGISDETFNANLMVQDEGSNKFDSLKSAVGEAQAKIQTLTWVKGQSGVSSADTTEQGDAIKIEYDSGIKGVILLYPDSTKGGSSSARSRQGVPQVPPSKQTRGTLDPTKVRLAYSQANEDTIGSTSVLVYDAFYQQFPEEGDEVCSLFVKSKCPKFTVTHLKDAECTVEKVKTFAQYGTIYISTHGGVTDGQVKFLTGEIATQAGKDKYIVELVLDEMGLATVKGKSYFSIFPFFITLETGAYPKSIVFNSSCYSANNQTMSDAFKNEGVLTYFGFSLSVGGTFSRTSGTGMFDKMINQQKKTGEAFTAGQTDPFAPHAEFKMYGSANARYVSDFVNGDFETGSLQGWTKEGDGRVISQLVFIDPTQGSFMGIISTGLGYTLQSGSISQGCCIPAGKTTLTFKYDFLSEEFKKYCGTAYQDYFEITIDSGGGETVLFYKNIDDLCGEVTQATGIHFDQEPPDPEDPNEKEDGVWRTGWTTESIDISSYAGKSVILIFKCGDIGDSIFDTAVLLDEIKFQ
ncbi:MAG: choice-of-anchor L domain-containing protein [candidate division Zixibacteria bacterium]|nr:choice-of-anchor L domain-containing protein [candidate division Zixibacteria bacterium]